MTRYHQLTSGERYALSALRRQGCSQAEIARTLGRPSECYDTSTSA
jgi:IS30 family transposase